MMMVMRVIQRKKTHIKIKNSCIKNGQEMVKKGTICKNISQKSAL